jgi:drug/metabolite transporter (DMT)-like permease
VRASPGAARVWAALAVVYVVWGSTYLFILLAERTMPVFVMSSLRFLIAGGLLYVWAIRRGDRHGDRPGRRAWVALVSTYAYVNPLVAVFLGWAVESEPIRARTLVAGLVVLAAVALIVTPPKGERATEPAPVPVRGR